MWFLISDHSLAGAGWDPGAREALAYPVPLAFERDGGDGDDEVQGMEVRGGRVVRYIDVPKEENGSPSQPTSQKAQNEPPMLCGNM